MNVFLKIYEGIGETQEEKEKNDYHVLLQMNLLDFRRETKTKATHKLLFSLRR